MVAQPRHKDPYRAFFTADEALGKYMAGLLDLQDDDTLLEPAAGDGHLIGAARSIAPNLPVTAYELHPDYADSLRRRFPKTSGVNVVQRDTIFCVDLDMIESFGPKFSKILANPPYGGWQEYERRADLKKRFPGFYVRETYTLFLLRCLRLLKDHGKLVFIIPNTFLYLHMHSALRKMILEEYSLESVDIFKSSFFPGISFGYADLCIICITARHPSPAQSFRLRFVDALTKFDRDSHMDPDVRHIVQRDVLRTPNFAIPLSPNHSELDDSTRRGITLAEIADCATGFYSGRDKEFLRRASEDVKRSNEYKIVDWDSVEFKPCSSPKILDGISGQNTFIPILKGGGYNFIKPNMWFVDWSQQAVSHYKSDKKARFQNSSYYFRNGIGFPMVTSTKPTAALIENSLFDQSIVGIFPKDGVSLEFLLAYCNSLPFWVCLKAINPSANNSAKYVLRTPIILPDKEDEQRIVGKTRELIHLMKTGESGAKNLQDEILKTITSYVKKQRSDKSLEPAVIQAVAQL